VLDEESPCKVSCFYSKVHNLAILCVSSAALYGQEFSILFFDSRCIFIFILNPDLDSLANRMVWIRARGRV